MYIIKIYSNFGQTHFINWNKNLSSRDFGKYDDIIFSDVLTSYDFQIKSIKISNLSSSSSHSHPSHRWPPSKKYLSWNYDVEVERLTHLWHRSTPLPRDPDFPDRLREDKKYSCTQGKFACLRSIEIMKEFTGVENCSCGTPNFKATYLKLLCV